MMIHKRFGKTFWKREFVFAFAVFIRVRRQLVELESGEKFAGVMIVTPKLHPLQTRRLVILVEKPKIGVEDKTADVNRRSEGPGIVVEQLDYDLWWVFL